MRDKDKLGHWQWQELIIKAPLPEGLKLTYITLRNFDNLKGCYPKLERVAERRGLAVRTVRRHLSALQMHGYLISKQTRGPSHYFFTGGEGEDLLIGELERVNQINPATPREGQVSDGRAREDTPREGQANPDTPREGQTEVALEVTREVQKGLGETRPLVSDETADNDGNGKRPPVKSQRHSERPKAEREDLLKLELVLKHIPGPYGIHQDSPARMYDQQGFKETLDLLIVLQQQQPPGQEYQPRETVNLSYG